MYAQKLLRREANVFDSIPDLYFWPGLVLAWFLASLLAGLALGWLIGKFRD